MDLDRLVGQKILAVMISPDGSSVGFRTETADLVYETYADCCSYTWIERVSGVENLLGQTVLAVEAKDLPAPEPKDHFEVIAVYAHDLQTARGVCQVEYRNESNGYYGGALELSDKPMPSTKITREWVCNNPKETT